MDSRRGLRWLNARVWALGLFCALLGCGEIEETSTLIDSDAIEIDVAVGEAYCRNGGVGIREVCDEGERNGDRSRRPLRVDPTTTRPGDGRSWKAPLKDLRKAVREHRGELWIRGGDNVSWRPGESLRVSHNMILRGGFAGTERTAAERLPTTPRTRLPAIVAKELTKGAILERVVIKHPAPVYGDPETLGLEVAGAEDLLLRDVELRGARVDIERSHVRFEQVDIGPPDVYSGPPYDRPISIRKSHFAWSGGSLGTGGTHAGILATDSRVLLQEIDVSGYVSILGAQAEGLIVDSNFYESGGMTGLVNSKHLQMERGTIVDSTFSSGLGVAVAPVSGGSLFVWNSSFLNLTASRTRNSAPTATALGGDEVEIVASTFYLNRCAAFGMACKADVSGAKRVTASLFVQEDPPLAVGVPSSSAAASSVDLEQGLEGNCFTYAVSAFTADPSYERPLLALAHPCPDAANAAELERARKRLLLRVDPFRVPFFDADLARYSRPNWWRRQSVRAGRCTDEGAPDPGAHHTLPCRR